MLVCSNRAWLWTAWDVNDDEIMRSSGLDAVVSVLWAQSGGRSSRQVLQS